MSAGLLGLGAATIVLKCLSGWKVVSPLAWTCRCTRWVCLCGLPRLVKAPMYVYCLVRWWSRLVMLKQCGPGASPGRTLCGTRLKLMNMSLFLLLLSGLRLGLVAMMTGLRCLGVGHGMGPEVLICLLAIPVTVLLTSRWLPPVTVSDVRVVMSELTCSDS